MNPPPNHIECNTGISLSRPVHSSANKDGGGNVILYQPTLASFVFGAMMKQMRLLLGAFLTDRLQAFCFVT
jgi:hypothetical protein